VADVFETGLRPVPFLDLAPSHAPLKHALLDDVANLIDSGAFTNGPQVADFEASFASYCGTSGCIGVASGLDGLRLALIAGGIGAGDEVLVPAMTFVATYEAVAQAGATPVPVDVREDDYCLDAELVGTRATSRARAVVPVHLYGQLTDMSSLVRVADERSLAIVEDACQAHGAERAGVAPGTRSLAAAFSFYPAKNLGAMGDAGAVVTNDLDLAARIRALREHGQEGKYHHVLSGWTSRLDTVQAAVLGHKLPLLDGWNDERRVAAGRYLTQLAGVGDLRLPGVAPDSTHVWHLFVIRTGDPRSLATFLAARGIGTARHYPEPPHLTRAWRHLGHRPGDFPVAEALARECLSLPIFPGITEEQQEQVVAGLREYFERG
jgi:dTDP-4-amino-4,6-dideoxygalactose transaminase